MDYPNMYFVYARDWTLDYSLMQQAEMLIQQRLDQLCSKRHLLAEALQSREQVQKHTLPWLWYNAIVITLQGMM
ncbi:hypothetical protein F5Y13DRAFT_198854 [Hypoxylon sp. FL1857]|nr:hypothetical protein F5Y13DRAFT_198854 [Hypoxylon sp. FL1857]